MAAHRSTRSLLGTVLLLVLALVLATVLAYQAQDAARSHRQAAERAVQDYASFANWQLSEHTRNGLMTTLVTALVRQASWVKPDSLEQTILTPSQVEEEARRNASWCRCLDSVEFFFRFDWKTRTLHTTESTVSPRVLTWARDTIERYTRALPRPSEQRPVAIGSSEGRFGPLRQLQVVITNDSYGMIVDEPDAHSHLLAFVVSRDLQGEPVVLYGFATKPAAFVAPTLELVRRNHRLLPPSLVHGMPEDSVVTFSVADQDGHGIFEAPNRFPTSFQSADTLDPAFASLVIRVGMRPEAAEQLVVGGLPRSRLPVLLMLLGLTAGLIIIALVQLRRQQELVRLRTEFISGVSHELRTPLAQIRWFAELLHMGRLRSDKERERSLQIIDQEARRLTYLVENVLAFARAERRASRITPTEVDLEREVRDALEAFAPLAKARRATVRLELEHGLTAHADRDALRQILLNVFDNAVKYGPVGQTLTVGTSRVGSAVRVWVDDQGPGIPAEQRDRVWEPYVRLGRETEGGTGGSGIGLSVVRELVSLHRGRVWVEDAPATAGRGPAGTRVVVELPTTAPEASGPDGPHDEVTEEMMWTSGTWPTGNTGNYRIP
ncbi:MAG TPA: HAMP domain-containing sensor histidine kinase [Gemmatimonadaceae bacterium]|nr:HAMP domain-containing sensor histidine kinase [Gemmatimonadaceae bacterium]